MTLMDTTQGKEYVISKVETQDEELNAFLFSLGCYSGEKIKVISQMRSGCILLIKNSRYNIDKNLAKAIII